MNEEWLAIPCEYSKLHTVINKVIYNKISIRVRCTTVWVGWWWM